MTVSPTKARPGSGAETDRAASQAVDNLTSYITNYMDTRKPTTVRGVVTAVTRDSTGINEVSIQRTGQAAADGSPYVVYAQGFVPIVGDRITLQKLGTSWLVVGADHGGRPNEHTIAYSGGSHRKYNAARVKQHEHFDTHHAVHYATDGATVAHHNHPSGQKAHTADHIHNATSITATGVRTGGHRKTHNTGTGRYEHHGPSDELVREHSQGYHAHYTTATRKHLHNDAGHTHPAGHALTDVSGVWTVTHSSGNKVQTHDGIIHTAYANGVIGHQIDAYKHYFRSGQNWEMARVEAAGSTTSTGGGRLHVKQLNTANTHILGDDGAGNLYIQHGAGNKVLDHNGTLNTLYHAAGSQVRTFDGTNVQHILKGNQHQILQAGSTTAYHTFGDDTTGRTSIFNAAGNRVLDHDNGTFRGYANAGALGWTHDGTTHQHYRGGVGTVALTSAGHVYSTAADGGIITIKQSSTTNAHQFGDDGSGNTHIQHPTGGRVLVHNGATFTGYAGGASQIGWTHDGVTHTHQAGGVGYHKLTTSAVQFGGSTTGAVHAMKQHGSSSMHLAGDDGAGLLHLAHATAGRVYDHTGALMRHLVSGQPAITHDGTTWTHYRGGTLTAQLSSAGAVYGTAADGGILSLRLTGSATAKHQYGDDGSGNAHIRHGGGNLALTHTGSIATIYAGSGGGAAITHNGSTHTLAIAGSTYAGIVHAAAGTGATMSVRSGGNNATNHAVGDDTTGALQAYSQGDHHIRVGAGVGDHHHTPTSHIFPPNSRVNAYSDRLDLLEQSNTYGAIKRNSHSVYVVYDQEACTLLAAGGVVVTHAAIDTYADPHFKFTEHVVWTGSNSGNYRHVAPNPIVNSGYGSGVDGVSNAYWNQLETYGNNTTAIYGKSVSGSNQSANSTQKYTGINN